MSAERSGIRRALGASRNVALAAASACALALTLTLGVVGCTQNSIGLTSRTFNRPIQLALVCLETATGLGRPIEDCRLNSSGESPAGLAMHALVLQEARGEVAAVDLVDQVVIDTDPAVPGYTFIPVAPLPTAIVIPTAAPSCAFIASAGASIVEALDLRAFRRESAADAEEFPAFELPGEPSAMVLDPDQDALWIAMPERSSVGRLAIDGCEFSGFEEIALSPDVPPGLVAASADDGATARYCPATFEPAPLPTLLPRDVAPLDAAARPATLAVGRELLVGDRALPLIHRIDLGSHAALAPFSVGATIRAMTVTPEVPSSYDPETYSPERFVYAIDDADGSVLVLDYTDPASAVYGAVLPVGATSSMRPDRVPFLSGARAIEVLRPLYDESAPFDQLCDPTSFPEDVPAPSFESLRGVFVAVGMNDASVRFIDVFDTDAPCRGRVEGASSDCSRAQEPFVYIRRHHPRIGVNSSYVGVVASDVIFLVNGATVRVGASSSDLEEIACPAPLRPIFAGSEDGSAARVCGNADPFEALGEIWVSVWQGALRGTSGAGTFRTLADGTIALDSAIDVCATGVMGSELAASAPPLEASVSAGDVIAITATLDEDMASDERCQAVIGVEGGTQSARPVLIPITRSASRPDGLEAPFVGRLFIDPSAPLLERSTPGLTVSDVIRCFGAHAVPFEVRARDAYFVAGTRSGARHRVVRGADGTCEVDASLPESWQNRARPGATFANDAIAFRIARRPSTDSNELRVTLGTVPATLNLDVGAALSNTSSRSLALPTDLHFSDVYQRFYIVDVQRRGLMETTMQPLRYTSTRFE